MTENSTPELDDTLLAAEVEEVDSLLTDNQRRRVEALITARGLITADSEPAGATGILGAFGTIGGDRLLGQQQQLASDLTTIADYIIGNDMPFSSGVLMIPTMVHYGVDAHCDDPACKMAAEFGGAEGDVPEGVEPDVEENLDIDEEGERPVATDSAIERHAQKQGVDWSDAWRYFEREGYDMSQATGKYDGSVSGSEDEIAQNDDTITTKEF